MTTYAPDTGSTRGSLAPPTLACHLVPATRSRTPAVSRRALNGTRRPQSSHWRGRLQCVVRGRRAWDCRLRGTFCHTPRQVPGPRCHVHVRGHRHGERCGVGRPACPRSRPRAAPAPADATCSHTPQRQGRRPPCDAPAGPAGYAPDAGLWGHCAGKDASPGHVPLRADHCSCATGGYHPCACHNAPRAAAPSHTPPAACGATAPRGGSAGQGTPRKAARCGGCATATPPRGATRAPEPTAPAPSRTSVRCHDAGMESHRLRHHPRRAPHTWHERRARRRQAPATTDAAPRGDRQPTDTRRASP